MSLQHPELVHIPPEVLYSPPEYYSLIPQGTQMSMMMMMQQQQQGSDKISGDMNTPAPVGDLPPSEISMKMFAMQVNPDGSMQVKQIPGSPSGKIGNQKNGRSRGRKGSRTRIKQQNSQINPPLVCCLDPSQQQQQQQQQPPDPGQSCCPQQDPSSLQQSDPNQQQQPPSPDYQQFLDQLNNQSPDYSQVPPVDANGNPINPFG
jgi:hypothetical protein